MNNLKVSFVIPVFNTGRYIAQCLDSICCQGYPNFEILAVNDSSTDDSLAVLNRYAEKDSRITVIDCKIRKGVSAARNLAISRITGDYIWMVDADDMIAKGALDILVSVIKTHQPEILTFQYEKLYRNKNQSDVLMQPISVNELSRIEFFRSIFDRTLNANNYAGGYVWLRVFKRSVVQNMLFAEEMPYYEDEDFFVRLYCLSLFNAKVISINSHLYYYRKRLSSLMNSNRVARLFSLYQFYRRAMHLFSRNSAEWKILDRNRFLCLQRLMQFQLSLGQTGAFSGFRKVLMSRLGQVKIRSALPYLLGRRLAIAYSANRFKKSKQRMNADAFWE